MAALSPGCDEGQTDDPPPDGGGTEKSRSETKHIPQRGQAVDADACRSGTLAEGNRAVPIKEPAAERQVSIADYSMPSRRRNKSSGAECGFVSSGNSRSFTKRYRASSGRILAVAARPGESPSSISWR